MIVGTGIDIIEIERFAHWYNYSNARLRKIFTDDEITYCKEVSAKSAERFAARFAVKEAFYKAFSQTTEHQIPFLNLCKNISVNHDSYKKPSICIDWTYLNAFINHAIDELKVHVSISHSRDSAIAMVIIENIN